MLDCLGDLVNREPSEHGAARYNGRDDEGDLRKSSLHRGGGIHFPFYKILVEDAFSPDQASTLNYCSG